MKKLKTYAAALLLLMASCNSDGTGIDVEVDKHDPQITIGNIAVAGQTQQAATRVDEDGLGPWYKGDVLIVPAIGTYTYTAHGTWKAGDDVVQLSQVVTPNGTFNAHKGGGYTIDQSTWEKYHMTDHIKGKLVLDGAVLKNEDATTLDHWQTDVVITIEAANTGWATGEFRQHIATSKIEVHSSKDYDGPDGKLDLYTPWLATLTDEKAEFRLFMLPEAVVDENSTIITITPNDGTNPITGKVTSLGGYDNSGTTKNQRLIIEFKDYTNQRSLGTGTAKIIPWADGGSNDLVHSGYDFVIRDENDLKAFRAAVNGGATTVTAIQVKDITLTEASWEPIGYFSGTYNGGGHTISELAINGGSNEIQGLFGRTDGATLTGINLTGVNVSGSRYVGALVGYAMNTTITYCSATGTQVSGTSDVGGLVGQNFSSSSNIVACWANVPVLGNKNIGGLVGSNAGGVVAFCYARGAVSINGVNGSMAGGLVGYTNNEIHSCYATGTVTGTGTDTGSLVGQNTSGTITYCYGGASNLKMIGSPTTPNEYDTAGKAVRSYTGTHADIDKSIWEKDVDEPLLTWQ
ncbi:hypothetical protein LJC05_00780 [Bacteroides sp. OttesenSCG-928-J23]|nr:hypothetical protein [Bacteroides sp. OttesenSCG-928-J23]MDL2299513.1 hypothetical protein [Bacteroides sp. OttesenSCG-928-E20]